MPKTKKSAKKSHRKLRAPKHLTPVTNFRLSKKILDAIEVMAQEESKEKGWVVSKADIVRMAVVERYYKKKRDT